MRALPHSSSPCKSRALLEEAAHAQGMETQHEKVNTIQQFTARFHVKDIYLFLQEEKKKVR